jgi:hypothetical protein
LGLAIVDRRYTEEGTSIGIFVLPASGKARAEKQKTELDVGDKVMLPAEATVLMRFPQREVTGPLPSSD